MQICGWWDNTWWPLVNTFPSFEKYFHKENILIFQDSSDLRGPMYVIPKGFLFATSPCCSKRWKLKFLSKVNTCATNQRSISSLTAQQDLTWGQRAWRNIQALNREIHTGGRREIATLWIEAVTEENHGCQKALETEEGSCYKDSIDVCLRLFTNASASNGTIQKRNECQRAFVHHLICVLIYASSR